MSDGCWAIAQEVSPPFDLLRNYHRKTVARYLYKALHNDAFLAR